MTTDRLAPRTLVSLILVPLLLAGGLLWGTWNAADRLRTVEAAVVNLDQMVELNGQPMPLGRQLTAALVDSERDQNLAWVLADEEGARAGLDSGRFAAVVTIPADFSAAATSFATAPDDAVQATLRVETSPIIGINETALGQSIAHAAANSLNRFLVGEYLQGIYLGFNEMGTQFVELKDGTALLADGAGQLADGADQAAQGAGELSDGLARASAGGRDLLDGTDQAADGSRQLAGGADELTAGASDLAAGTATFATGVGSYADGVTQLAAGSRQYAEGVATFAEGTQLYTDGVAQYVGAVNPLVVQVRDFVRVLPEWDQWLDDVAAWVDGLPAMALDLDARVQRITSDLTAVLTQLRDLLARTEALDSAVHDHREALAAISLPCPAELQSTPEACAAFADGVTAASAAAAASADEMAGTAAQWSVEADELGEMIDGVITAADRLASFTGELARRAPALREQFHELAGQLPSGSLPSRADLLALLDQFISGGDQLLTGGTDLAAGATQLAAGGDELATGAETLATGGRELADGASELGDGVGTFADGVSLFGDGVGALAGGLTALADGVGLYTAGIAQAADGSAALTGGLSELAGGAGELSAGVSELATGVAAGAQEIPTYTDTENLAMVAAAPVNAAALDALVHPHLSWASLLLVLALWLGALATYLAIGVGDRRWSTEATSTLLWRTLRRGYAITATQALLLTVLGASVLGLSAGRALGLGVILLVAAAAFTAVNHALAWMAAPGRVVALAMALLGVVPAVSAAAPGVFDALRSFSPLAPALDAVRAVMTGSPTLPVLALILWILLGVAASALAVTRSRTVPLRRVAVSTLTG